MEVHAMLDGCGDPAYLLSAEPGAEVEVLTDEQILGTAERFIVEKEKQSPEDAAEYIEGYSVKRGWWRWVGAPEDHECETLLEPCEQSEDAAAFLGYFVRL